MAVPNEGTQQLPTDANGIPIDGLWDATGQKFYAFRDNGAHALKTDLWDATGFSLAGNAADAASTATDTTRVGFTGLFKQISASVQALAAIISSGRLLTTAILAAGTALIGKVAGSDGNALLTDPAATGNAATGMLGVAPQVYNGTTFDSDVSIVRADAVNTGAGVKAVGLYLKDTNVAAKSGAAGAGTNPGFLPAHMPYLHNGSNADPQQNNGSVILLASAAHTTTQHIGDQTNYNGRGVQAILNVTAASGTGGLTLTIEGKDPVSGTYYALNATPTGVTATGITIYELYPGVGAASGGVTQRTSGALPRVWRVTVTAGDASSYTYSVGVMPIL